jgi:hypothetical protein
MASLLQTAGTVVIAHQAVTHPNSVFSAAINVATKLAGILSMFHASVEAAANTNPGSFIVQYSAAEAGDEDWVEYARFTAQVSTADTEAMTATEPAGETELVVASTTGFVAGDILYIQDTGTLADSEWADCDKIVPTGPPIAVWLARGLTNQKDSSDVIWNDAERFICAIDFSVGIKRIAVIFRHEGAAGADVHIKVHLNTGDSIG